MSQTAMCSYSSKTRKSRYIDPYSGDGPTTQVEDVTFFALADKDMNIILDDIDMVPDWYADFFIAKTGSTKWERIDKSNTSGNGTCGLFDPKTENLSASTILTRFSGTISTLSAHAAAAQNLICWMARAAKPCCPQTSRSTAAGPKPSSCRRRARSHRVILLSQAGHYPRKTSPCWR